MHRLTKRNADLRKELTHLEKAKTELYALIKNHFNQCGTNNNIFTNNNTGSTKKTAGASAPIKREMPATACLPKVAATDYHVDSIYQSYSSDNSGVSHGYSAVYE